MGVTVIVNKMTVSHKGSGGKSIAFPDVCKTPTPGGPVPIPYPNIAMSSDLDKGSKTVKMDGEPVMLKGSNIKRSSGDEPGTIGGIISGKNMGKAEFINYSFDVKVDGENVCRLLDPTKQNMGSNNIPGLAHLQKAIAVTPAQEEEACKKIKNKKKKQTKKGETGWENSGIWTGHQQAIQEIADDELWILYFRDTGKYPQIKWIPEKHMPKPHSALKANTIKEKNLSKAQKWIDRYYDNLKNGKKQTVWKSPPDLPKDATELFGVCMSTANHNEGKPLVGKGRDSNRYSYKGKWMTGDYDLMDVLDASVDDCQRPIEDGASMTSPSFGKVQDTLNEAMGWDGIQHPPQAAWISVEGEDNAASSFHVSKELKAWVQTKGKHVPKKVLAEGRDPSALVDNKLTIVNPKEIPVFLEKNRDVKDQYICHGCGR